MASKPEKLSLSQRHALLYVGRYETAEHGVIIRHVTGHRLVERGYMDRARRRPFARTDGLCVRLTAKGRRWVE